MMAKSDAIDNMITYPWCYMPPEMHFLSPKDLTEAMFAFSLSRMQDELNDSNLSVFLLPPLNKFEKVRSKQGKYVLIPTALDYSFLFRGQTDFYEECLPTLYRKAKTVEELLLDRLRICEFEDYLRQFPQVKDFERLNFKIDYIGLAQHYGLRTEVIDLTSSLNVALFFAMCNMSNDGKTFYPQQEDKEYIGYIYAVKTFDFEREEISSLFDGKLSVIGMQPFYRPGNQRGFGLHLEKGETMTGLLYSFSYTKQDSEAIFDYFLKGDILWHEDEISRVAREIKDANIFSFHALDKCFRRYFKGNRSAKKEMRNKLRAMGCEFQKVSMWKIDQNTLTKMQADYVRHGGFDGMNAIVQREIRDEYGHTKHCIDTNTLTNLLLMKFPQSGCKAPDDYVSPFDYEESRDKTVWGFSSTHIEQEKQTIPNPETRRVDKWTGDWRTLNIDYHRDKKLKMKAVRMH